MFKNKQCSVEETRGRAVCRQSVLPTSCQTAREQADGIGTTDASCQLDKVQGYIYRQEAGVERRRLSRVNVGVMQNSKYCVNALHLCEEANRVRGEVNKGFSY